LRSGRRAQSGDPSNTEPVRAWRHRKKTQQKSSTTDITYNTNVPSTNKRLKNSRSTTTQPITSPKLSLQNLAIRKKL
jgi:hypothetical protein